MTDTDTASYPGDWAQTLVAFDITVVVSGANDDGYTIAFEDSHVRPTDKRLEAEYVRLSSRDIIAEFLVPLTPALRNSIYTKARDRKSYAFAALGIEFEDNGETVREARLGLGGVATVPWRATEAEDALPGLPLTEANARAAGEAAFASAVTFDANAFKVPLGINVIVHAAVTLKRLEA